MNQVLRVIIGGVAGAAVGFLLYKIIGCRTGACPLYGNPYLAIIIWCIVGALVASRIR